VRKYSLYLRNCCQRRCQNKWESFASFATIVIFSLLSETVMSYFFHNVMLLLLFDNLRTAPPRLSIKLTRCNNPYLLHLTSCLHCWWWCNHWCHSHVKAVTAQRLST